MTGENKGTKTAGAKTATAKKSAGKKTEPTTIDVVKHDDVYPAFVAAQREFSTVEKNKNVNVSKNGKFLYAYKYADLDGILAMVRPILAKNGLSFTQGVEIMETAKGVAKMMVTTIMHSSGKTIRSGVPMTGYKTDLRAQDAGGNLTFFKRYSLSAALGITTDEDVDAADFAFNDGNQDPDRGNGNDTSDKGSDANNEASGAQQNSGTQQGNNQATQAGDTQNTGGQQEKTRDQKDPAENQGPKDTPNDYRFDIIKVPVDLDGHPDYQAYTIALSNELLEKDQFPSKVALAAFKKAQLDGLTDMNKNDPANYNVFYQKAVELHKSLPANTYGEA